MARSVLIVADDAWRLDDIEPLVGVAGQRGHLLFTTRDRRVASDVAARELAVDVLTPDQSTQLLASWSNTDIDRLPSEAFEVARECGYLPLALSIMGATVRGRPQRWSNVLQRLQNADLRASNEGFPTIRFPNLIRAMDVSLEALDSQTVERYVYLAGVCGNHGFLSESFTNWAPLELPQVDVDDLLDRLEDCSLLHRARSGRLTLHDLQYDYVISRIDDRAVLHRPLLDAYAALFPRAWRDCPDDRYFFQHLPQHLRGARREREQAELPLDLRWMRASSTPRA